ncbi:MAG: CoB--CoM heterodisulfide reductase iron-sulfur subunit B family protein [Thermodesulfobacteriota bacterium]
MKYAYYPGCSLEGTAQEYDVSTRAVMKAAGHDLVEIEDWSCCGASAAEATSELLALALAARNLALAENSEGDILAPCSACYLNLRTAQDLAERSPADLARVNQVLEEVGLKYRGRSRVRHLLDVVVRDLGPDLIRSLVRKPLTGLRLAPYYGCQCLRPYHDFDDPEAPRSMEPALKATGADVHPWDMGGRCCGASHMTTKPEVALKLVEAILSAARGADALVTVCPMCQMNLEAYQDRISKDAGWDLRLPVLYLSQVLGLAWGLPEKDLRLDLNLSVPRTFGHRPGP